MPTDYKKIIEILASVLDSSYQHNELKAFTTLNSRALGMAWGVVNQECKLTKYGDNRLKYAWIDLLNDRQLGKINHDWNDLDEMMNFN